MSDNTGDVMPFAYGSEWLRVDFHLHTRVDPTFKYDGSDFVNEYVDTLNQADIRIGVITNHNIFDWAEFKTLRRKAKKKHIWLLPGVELSVKDGKNGIHLLLVFSDEWLDAQAQKDYINDFLTAAFQGQTSSGVGARCNYDLSTTLEELNKLGKDYFVVCAHVEESGGLWHELGGGRIAELGRYDAFTDRCLGFQQVRTHDEREKIRAHLGAWYPAEVEGCDCKCLDDIKRERYCYVQLGDHVFESLQGALRDGARVVSEIALVQHSHIRSIRYIGGMLDGHELRFSTGLNTLIGVRGSAKSAVLETIRYGLGLPLGHKAHDAEYKDKLIPYFLGSGGQVVIEAVDRQGALFEIRRTVGAETLVYEDGDAVSDVDVMETVLRSPLYFGQGDLSNTGDGFEQDLVEKLLGEALADVRSQISDKCHDVESAIGRIATRKQVEAQIEDERRNKGNAEFRLKRFAETGVQDKLKKQSSFNRDSEFFQAAATYASEVARDAAKHVEELQGHGGSVPARDSEYNQDLVVATGELLQGCANLLVPAQQIEKDATRLQGQIADNKGTFDDRQKAAADEFAAIKRQLEQDLKEQGFVDVSPDDFLKAEEQVKRATAELTRLETQRAELAKADDALRKCLVDLRELWFREFELIAHGLAAINQSQSALEIRSEYQGDKEAFAEQIRQCVQGSNVRKTRIDEIAEQFCDGIDIYENLGQAMETAGGSDSFGVFFMNSLCKILTYQVPNKYTVMFHGKELKQHSLGQRASALMMFILSRKGNDIILIDQPEDDLDNQTIYEDVIKMIAELKPRVQFIFATHNANIPVLGNAEQIHACRFTEPDFSSTSGSIDKPELQKMVVDIMEGGQEAFNRRNEIYSRWKPALA